MQSRQMRRLQSKQKIFICSSCSGQIMGGPSFSGISFAPPCFRSSKVTTLCPRKTFSVSWHFTHSLQMKSVHWRQNAKAFDFEHISHAASTLPCAFSILPCNSFIRLTKNGVGSRSGSFWGRRVSWRHSGQGKGRLRAASCRIHSLQ